jgi:hypothetical protein
MHITPNEATLIFVARRPVVVRAKVLALSTQITAPVTAGGG